jgi:hypothetical protein
VLDRHWISNHYIKGNGIEIGAHHFPFPLNKQVTKTTYIDKWSKPELIKLFPEIQNKKTIPETQLIENGETLKSIPNESQDFVLASHVFEHFESPYTGLENHLRVLKKDGIIFYAIPEMSQTFDKNRKPTAHDHVTYDYHADPKRSLAPPTERELSFWESCLVEHHKEFCKVVDGIDLTDEQALKSIREGRDVHYHCWDEKGILELFARHPITRYSFKIELYAHAGHEVFVVLKKR